MGESEVALVNTKFKEAKQMYQEKYPKKKKETRSLQAGVITMARWGIKL